MKDLEVNMKVARENSKFSKIRYCATVDEFDTQPSDIVLTSVLGAWAFGDSGKLRQTSYLCICGKWHYKDKFQVDKNQNISAVS